MSRRTDRSAYCHDQANQCSLRSSHAALPEIRDAYLQLELGWRQLIPDFDPAPNISVMPKQPQCDEVGETPAQNTDEQMSSVNERRRRTRRK